jgi:hypothetical protein
VEHLRERVRGGRGDGPIGRLTLRQERARFRAALRDVGERAQRDVVRVVDRNDPLRFSVRLQPLLVRREIGAAEAAAVDERFSKAWSAADVRLTASRF